MRGMATLEEKILELAVASPSIRAEWPPEWLSVRNEIRSIRRERPYMTPEKFRNLLEKHDVTTQETQ
jgi:hypothetical protein